MFEYKQRIKVKGQGEYELTVKNLVNPLTMKSLTPGSTFLNQGYIRALQNEKHKKREQMKKKMEDSARQKKARQAENKKIRAQKNQQIRKQLLPKLLRNIMTNKLKKDFKHLKFGLMTLKHDKMIYKQEKVLRLMRIAQQLGTQKLKSAFSKLKIRKVPALNLKSIKQSIGQKSSIFGFTDIDPNEFGTFVSKANSDDQSFVHNFSSKRLSKKKLEAFMKLVLVLEKKIMVRRFDFWLPLRRFDQAMKTKSQISYGEPTLMKRNLNDELFEDELACEQFIKNYGHQVTLKKISTDYMPLEQCEISVIEENNTYRSPIKKGYMDDSVDLEFRKLALKEEDLNDTAMDLCDILGSNSKRGTADRTVKYSHRKVTNTKMFKIMDDSGNARSPDGEDSSMEIIPLTSLPTDRGHKQHLDELQNEIEDLDNEVNQILRQLQDGSEHSENQFEELYGDEIEQIEDKNSSEELLRLEKWNM